MNSIKKVTVILIALLSVITSSMIASAANDSISNNTEQKKELYLIIQSTRKALIEKDDAKSNTFKLTLFDVPTYATAFTQRPIRKAQLITLAQFLNLWKNADPDGFKKNPPNAAINALIVNSKSEEHLNYFVQLMDPVYNTEQKTLSYRIKPLEGNQTLIPDSVTLEHVNLFIDDICLNCWWP